LNNYYKNSEQLSNKDNITYSSGKPVYQLDKDTGEVIGQYECMVMLIVA